MLDASSRNTTFNQLNTSRPVGLPDLIDILLRRKWYLASSIFISLGLGAIYLVYAQPTYEVTSRVLVQPEGLPVVSGVQPRRELEFLATQGEIISSPAVIKRAVDSMKQPLTLDPELEPVLAVQTDLTVKPLVGTNVLSLAYRSQNPEEGIAIVEAILDSYQQFLQKRSSDSRLEALSLLTRSEERLRNELEDREKRYRDVRKRSPLIGQGKNTTIFQTTLLEQLGQSLSVARNRRIDFQNRMELLAKSSDDGLAAHVAKQSSTVAVFRVPLDEQPTEPTKYSQNDVLPTSLNLDTRRENIALDLLADVKLSGTSDSALILQELYLAEVRKKLIDFQYGTKHPNWQAIRIEIKALKDRLGKLDEQARIDLQREFDVAQSHETQLFDLYNLELEKAKANDEFQVIEQQKLDGIERLKTAYNSLVVQLNDFRLLQPNEHGVLGINMTVLEAPTIGLGPIWPKKSVLAILCGMIGLLGGLALIFVSERDAWARNTHYADNTSDTENSDEWQTNGRCSSVVETVDS